MGRVLRFLFALPLAMAMTFPGSVADATLPPPPPKEDRDDRAVTEPPELEIDDEDQPKFYLGNISNYNPDRDAAPIRRDPIAYPEICLNNAKPVEQVFLEFDVAPEGMTENIRAVDSTNSCFDQAAVAAVASWIYEPKMIDGEPAWRRGVQTVISFELH